MKHDIGRINRCKIELIQLVGNNFSPDYQYIASEGGHETADVVINNTNFCIDIWENVKYTKITVWSFDNPNKFSTHDNPDLYSIKINGKITMAQLIKQAKIITAEIKKYTLINIIEK